MILLPKYYFKFQKIFLSSCLTFYCSFSYAQRPTEMDALYGESTGEGVMEFLGIAILILIVGKIVTKKDWGTVLGVGLWIAPALSALIMIVFGIGFD